MKNSQPRKKKALRSGWAVALLFCITLAWVIGIVWHNDQEAAHRRPQKAYREIDQERIETLIHRKKLSDKKARHFRVIE